MKKFARPERKTSISFNKKNLDWSKFFCRQDLKVQLYVCLLEIILLLFRGELWNKNFKTFFSWIKGMQNKYFIWNVSVQKLKFLDKKILI